MAWVEIDEEKELLRIWEKEYPDTPPLGYAEYRPLVIVGGKPDEHPGLVTPGTIDLNKRPVIQNEDGTVSTEQSFGIEEDGKEILIPQVVYGKPVSQEAALWHYRATGEHLGKFDSVEHANAYAEKLHQWQELGVPKKYAEEEAAKQPGQPPTQYAESDLSKEALEGSQVGLVEPGTIDINDRTPVEIPEGDIDTEGAISITAGDGKNYLIPTVIDGKAFSTNAAIRDFQKTGKHLGVFKSKVAAMEYADRLRDRQVKYYGLKPTILNLEKQYDDETPRSLAPTFPTREEEIASGGKGPNYPAESAEEDIIPLESETAPQSRWQEVTEEPTPSRWQEVDEEPTPSGWQEFQNVGIVTAYRPGGGASMGLNAGIEGADLDAHDTPILGRTTFEDYIDGRGDYVTVAMDKNSSWQGQFLSSPNFPGMVFQVRDNGGYGNGKTGENWIDIAFTDPQKAKSMLLRGVPFTPITPEQAQTMSASRENITHTPRLQALYVPGGSFSQKEETGLPDPFMEFTARTARGVETGTREMFGGALNLIESAFEGERNIYAEKPEQAEGDIAVLEEQVATLQKELRDRVLKDDPASADWALSTAFDSPELGKLDKQLKDARRAVAGDVTENVMGQVSRQTERLAVEAEQNQVAAMRKWEPYISASRDTQWGMQLGDALGRTVPGVLTSIYNPILGAAAIYAQIYQSSLQQYMAEKPDATREEAQKFANSQALVQAPWALAGNQLTARALKASFAALPAGAVERGARIFGTQLGQAISKNAQAFIGNVGSAVGQSVTSDMVSEDYDLLEDTTIGEKVARAKEPASLAAGVSAVFGAAGVGVAAAKRPTAAKPKAEPAPKEVPTKEITIGPKEAPFDVKTATTLPAKYLEPEPVRQPIADKQKALQLEGITNENAKALLSGKKTPEQVVAEQMGIHEMKGGVEADTLIVEEHPDGTRTGIFTPEAGPAAGSAGDISTMSHSEAIRMAHDQGVNRVKDILAAPTEEKPPTAEKAPEEGKAAPTAAKPAGFLNLNKSAIEQDFGPEWKTEVASAYEAIKTGKSYITEVDGSDMFMHFAKDFPGENWRQDTANFMRRQFGIEGAKFTHKGKEHTVHFKEKPPEKFSPEEGGLALAIPRPPPTPGAPRAPAAALPPPKSIVGPIKPLPKGHIISIVPVLKNPLMRRHVEYAPGQRAGFGGLKSPIGQWKRFFIGTAEVMEKVPGLEGLGQKIRDYVDDKALFYAQENNWARLFEKTINAKEKGIAQEEFHRFFLQANDPSVNVQKQAIPTYWAASEKGRELIDQTRDYLNRTGIENQAMGFTVFDPSTQKFRPIGKIAGGGDPIPAAWYPGWKPGYFPRMISRNHMEIINDPTGNVPAYETLKDHVEAMGFPRDSIDSHLSNLREKASSNEFFAAVDLARTSELPNTIFDYSFETVRRYMAARAERKAQINNFGQVKAFAGPESLTLFDRYLNNTNNFLGENVRMDKYTQNYVERVRDNVLNIQTSQDPAATAVQKLGTVLTGVHLGDPLVASRNLAGGQMTVAGILGAKHYLKGVKDAFSNIDEAYEKGIILQDMANLMEQAEGLGGVQKFTNWMLKWSGESKAENFNRMVNLGAAKSLLRDALDEYKTKGITRKSRGYMGHFKRMGGIDPQALMDEGGKGPMTDRYLRQSVRFIQGGYQIDQTPLFQNTDNAKFFFKYSKFGTQHLDLFSKEVIRPAIRELTFGKYKKETVEVRNPDTGKMETHPVPGNLSTAVRYFLAMAAGGTAATAFARYAFGAEDKTESWTEIIRKLDKDKQAAFFDILYKLFQYSMVSGAGGYLGNVAQYGLDWTQKTRVKDPLNPPIMDLATNSMQLLKDAAANGGVPRLDDLHNYLRRNVSSYRSAMKFGAYWGNDVFPLGFKGLQRESMLQDMTWLRTAVRRFEQEKKIEAPPGGRPLDKNPMSAFNMNLNNALMLGDVPEARRLLDERIQSAGPNAETVMDSIMDSVRARRPIKAGGSTSEAMAQNFMRWADENMSAADAAKIRRIDKIYTNTAIAAGILKPGKEKTSEDIAESLRRMQIRTEMRQTR